jgi:hypothetical protein
VGQQALEGGQEGVPVGGEEGVHHVPHLRQDVHVLLVLVLQVLLHSWYTGSCFCCGTLTIFYCSGSGSDFYKLRFRLQRQSHRPVFYKKWIRIDLMRIRIRIRIHYFSLLRSGSSSESRISMTKNCNKFTAEKKFDNF